MRLPVLFFIMIKIKVTMIKLFGLFFPLKTSVRIQGVFVSFVVFCFRKILVFLESS